MDRGDVPSLYEADCVAPATITFTPSSELKTTDSQGIEGSFMDMDVP